MARKAMPIRGREEVAQPIALPSLQPAVISAKLFAREDFARAINAAWDTAQQRFVDIGRCLVQAKDRLPHGEFMAMVAADLPFKHATANKLMTVARFVDSGTVPPDSLPAASETCYEITTLTDEERAVALRGGLIRPDVRRAEIQALKRQMRAPQIDERAQLLAERERLMKRLQEIEQRLSEA